MNTPSLPNDDTAARRRALPEQAPGRRWWRRALPLLLLAAAFGATALGLAGWQAQRQASAAPRYVTEAVKRGDLLLTVTANGSLQPTRQVNIGSELSGTVTQVMVDVNDKVSKGQVLLTLDTAKLGDQVVRARAALASAEAAVALAAATVRETEANLARLEQLAQLSGGTVPSKAELDTARAALARSRASADSARANVVSARATLSTDETNLSKASIRAPINGVILSRSVDPGNAVAASLQAVTLFTIAEDLHQLRLQVNVDEADVSAVQVGQHARFTVSAYANRSFPTTVTRVGFGSTITDNVVTYLTYLAVDNADLNLRPGMTATAVISATEHRDVLLVPNTALRYTPAAKTSAPAGATSIVASLMPRGPTRAPRRPAASNASTAAARHLWVLRDGAPAQVSVMPGISNGRMTEIVGGELKEGMQVITDQRSGAAR